MKKILISLLLIVSILISGCGPKIIIKKEYIYEEPFDFQKVNLSGAYIEISEKENICIPKLQELNKIYKDTKLFYDNQIDDYTNIANNKEKESEALTDK